MELLLHQWGDWPELYRNTDKTEATEIVIIYSQMNYRGKLDTYNIVIYYCEFQNIVIYCFHEKPMIARARRHAKKDAAGIVGKFKE